LVKNTLNSKIKRVVFITTLFLYSTLFANTNISFDGYIYSDNLKLNTFEQDDKEIRKYNKENNVIANYNLDLNYQYKDFIFGISKEENFQVMINNGFIKTWNFVNQNFDTLLNSQQIADNIGNIDMQGDYKSSKYNKIYIQKGFNYNSHSFLIKANIIKATELQDLKVYGKNKNNHFLLYIDYFYYNKNIITKEKTSSNYGYGTSLDFDYKYKYKNFNANILLEDLFGYINWKNVTYMRYIFDSNTKVLGEDGFYHLNAFGQGKYYYNINYKQKLDIKYKINLKYKVNNILTIYNNIQGIKSTYFDHLYLAFSKNNIHVNIGNVLNTNTLTYGLGYKNFNLIASKTNTNTQSIILSMKYKF